MIIDIAYIKSVLNTEVDDSVINYLIKHFFNYICSKAKIDSTLEEEEISTTNNDINPNILEDELTLFQETLIYGIGCELTEIGELYTINEDIKQKYPDLTTYCDFFNYCLDTLVAYLNATSDIEIVRRLFSLDTHLVSDNDLAFLIQYFTDYILAYLPEDQEIDTESKLFKQALYTQIACHIFRTNPTAIISPKSYKVDEVRETFVLDFDKNKNTWCDIANEDLANLKKKIYGLYGVYAYDRPGARSKYGYHGPKAR